MPVLTRCQPTVVAPRPPPASFDDDATHAHVSRLYFHFLRRERAARCDIRNKKRPRLSDACNLSRAAVFLGGYCHFAAVRAEVFAASRRSWRRSLPRRGGHGGGLFYTDTKTTQKFTSHATSAYLSQGPAWGLRLIAALAPPGDFFGEIIEKKKKKPEKKPPPLAVGGGGHVAVFAAPPWRSRRSFADTAGGHGGHVRRPTAISW